MKYRVQVSGVKVVEADSPLDAANVAVCRCGLMDARAEILGEVVEQRLDASGSTLGMKATSV